MDALHQKQVQWLRYVNNRLISEEYGVNTGQDVFNHGKVMKSSVLRQGTVQMGPSKLSIRTKAGSTAYLHLHPTL